MKTKKLILVSDGQNDVQGYTWASTEKGFIAAAKRIWPHANPFALWIKVLDDFYYAEKGVDGDLIFDEKVYF